MDVLDHRTFNKHIMKSGVSLIIRIPNGVIDGLNLEDRDEVEITMRKTGRKVPVKERFKKKEAELDERKSN